jgi:hypothetical protein
VLFLLLTAGLASADCASAQTRQRRSGATRAGGSRQVNSGRFPGANVCAKIQAAIDSLAASGGTVVADAAGDCGATTQVRVRGGVTLRLPQGTFSYSMRGYGGRNNTVGALFLLDSDSTLEGAGPGTVIKESSWVHTSLSEQEQRGAISNGEYVATFKVIIPYATSVATGSTSRNITVRNLKLAGGKPNVPGSFNSAGGALDLANCHNCLVENVHMERTRSIGIHVGGNPAGGQDPGADLAERGVREPLGRYADNVTVRNCFFSGVASQNLALVNGRNITFENNRFVRPGLAGGPGSTMIDVEPNHPGDYLENVRIVNNYLDARETELQTAGNGIVVQATSGTVRVGPILIEGNEIIGGNTVPPLITNKMSNGIYVFGQTMRNVVIRNNRVTRSGQAGISIEGTAIQVINNQLTDVGGGGNPGFYMARVVDSRIENNTFTYTGKGPADSRILMTAGTRNNVFRGNRGFSEPEEKR